MLTHKGTVELTTRGLRLRRFRREDAQEMFDAWANDERVTAFLSWTPHQRVENTEALLDRWCGAYEQPDTYHWGIVYDGRPVGSMAVMNFSQRDENCEVGYCIAHDCWGQGITAEALKEILRFLFEEVGFHRVMAKHDTENPNSGRVMQKGGMRPEGILRGFYKRHDGTFADAQVYGIAAEDWRELHERERKADSGHV